MTPEGPAAGERNRSLRLSFLAVLVLELIATVLSYVAGQLIFRYGYSQSAFDYNLSALYTLLASLVYFVLNPGIIFVAFYKLSQRLRFASNSDYLALLKYLLAGGILGYFVAYGVEDGLSLWIWGSFFSVTNVGGFLSFFIFGPVSNGVEVLFVAFVAVVVGHLRSSALLASGKELQQSSGQPEDSPQQT